MGGFRVGSVLGFEIRIDQSWFVILVLIVWSFSAGVFPTQYPGQSTGLYFAMGFAAAVLFFASLLAHEVSHSVVARAKGIPVEGITLFIFGGVARTKLEAERPGDEFQIAAVGPLMSLVLAALFEVGSRIGPGIGLSTALTIISHHLAFLNLALAIFNLFPGFPLDGGRIFRSIVWKLTGDLTKATRWATTGGRLGGTALMALGVIQFLAGAGLGGLWLVFIGWFLHAAAIMSHRQFMARSLLDGVVAREVMTPYPHVVPPDLPVREVIESHFLKTRYEALPVVDDRGRPVGLVTLKSVKEVPFQQWPFQRVWDVMVPVGGITVGPDAEISRVLELMEEESARRVLVVDQDVLVGVVSTSDVSSWLERSAILSPRDLEAA